MNLVQASEVTCKRYSNSDKVPEKGDIVENSNGDIFEVGSIGGCYPMFHNCTIEGCFYLTDPEDLELIS